MVGLITKPAAPLRVPYYNIFYKSGTVNTPTTPFLRASFTGCVTTPLIPLQTDSPIAADPDNTPMLIKEEMNYR